MKLDKVNMVFKKPGSLLKDKFIHVLRDISLEIYEGQKAIINVYRFEIEAFSSVKYAMKVFDEYNRDWLDFVADSRKGKSPWMDWDWIEGGIANDSVITTVDAYVDGFITSEQAIDRLVKEELRHQICIRNQEIIDRYLVFEKYEEI